MVLSGHVGICCKCNHMNILEEADGERLCCYKVISVCHLVKHLTLGDCTCSTAKSLLLSAPTSRPS